MQCGRACGTGAFPANGQTLLVGLALSSLLFGSPLTVSARPSAIATLTSPNSQNYGEFGYSVAASGNIVVAGAPHESFGGYTYAGRAYIFDLGSGAPAITLTSPVPENYGEFGYSVAINGSTVIVGGDGNAYVFDSRSGSLVDTLSSPNSQDNLESGNSFAVSGSVALAGAPQEDVGQQISAGRANITNARTGALVANLTSPNPQDYGEFGFSVAVGGNVSVVGAPDEAVGSYLGAGRTYVFNSEAGALVYNLTSPDSQYYGNFGYSVSTSGEVVVVGAPGEGVGGAIVAGRVYAFNLASAIVETSSSATTTEVPNSNSLLVVEVTIAAAALVGGLAFAATRVSRTGSQHGRE